MGLISYTNMENDQAATANMFNSRFAAIIKEVNGNLGSENIRKGSLTADNFSADVFGSIYPVGSVYINAEVDTNPATLLGFGTWVSFGAGRVPVGFDAAQTEFNAAQKEGGAKTHTLSANEMPSHNHSVDPPSTSTSSDTHNHTLTSIVDNNGSSNTNNALTSYYGANLRITSRTTSSDSHNHTVNIGSFNSGSRGGGAAHNNLQPYVTVYMWKRTA